MAPCTVAFLILQPEGPGCRVMRFRHSQAPSKGYLLVGCPSHFLRGNLQKWRLFNGNPQEIATFQGPPSGLSLFPLLEPPTVAMVSTEVAGKLPNCRRGTPVTLFWSPPKGPKGQTRILQRSGESLAHTSSCSAFHEGKGVEQQVNAWSSARVLAKSGDWGRPSQ